MARGINASRSASGASRSGRSSSAFSSSRGVPLPPVPTRNPGPPPRGRPPESRGVDGALALGAGDFDGPPPGRLVLRGVAAAVPGSRPFLTADEAEVEVDVREGLRRSLHVRHLAAEGVRIDLSAPLPASKGTSTGDLTFLSAAEIDHIDVGISRSSRDRFPRPCETSCSGEDRESPADRKPSGGTLNLRGTCRPSSSTAPARSGWRPRETSPSR